MPPSIGYWCTPQAVPPQMPSNPNALASSTAHTRSPASLRRVKIRCGATCWNGFSLSSLKLPSHSHMGSCLKILYGCVVGRDGIHPGASILCWWFDRGAHGRRQLVCFGLRYIHASQDVRSAFRLRGLAETLRLARVLVSTALPLWCHEHIRTWCGRCERSVLEVSGRLPGTSDWGMERGKDVGPRWMATCLLHHS